MYRILAVAVGKDNSTSFPNPITAPNPANVRPYIDGLIDGLNFGYGVSIGNPNYDIWYRECPPHTANVFSLKNDLIFPMSTTVTLDAINSGTTNPIVFPTGSNFTTDFKNSLPKGVFKKLPNNLAGIDAQRDQGDMLLKNFQKAFPSLETLYYLKFDGHYGPSDRAEGKLKGVNLNPLKVKNTTDFTTQLPNLKNKADGKTGLLVLPIDFCLGQGSDQAPYIIQVAQVQYSIPTFFPIPDWAYQTTPTPAFGAWGLSQYLCGRLASDLVYSILWGGMQPYQLGIVPAPPSLFDLVVNKTAADRLKISLPKHLERQVRP